MLPELGSHAGRARAGAGEGGDVTFAIDELAERRVEEYVRERAPDVAFYSEDRGMVAPAGEPRWVLVVDPIDGTRPAMAGFESACVSVAAAPLAAHGCGAGEGTVAGPTMGDVVAGAIVEIKSGAGFVAERGGGVEPGPRLSGTEGLDGMFWAYGLRGRPAAETVQVLAPLLDASSVTGGTFDLGSATYDITRILTGQLDAYVEPGPRLVEEVEGMRARFERVGRGAVLNNSPYDLAAAVLCLEEGGGIVTDANGGSLAARPLLGSGVEYQMSCVAAANPILHAAIIESLDEGIESLRSARR